mmetsp:Transcript_80005/g.232288  ORF Transcript_80005/g.232288 Transcript_80005/m.232288 type:complete len:592 (+) Transcript_80005:106-1881(+)
MGAADGERYGALQLVTLNMKEKKVEVNEDALGRLEKNLRKVGAQKVAVVSVMGAFRTGKSFLLDLFLRHLRYEKKLSGDGVAEPQPQAEVPERGGDEAYPLPAWMTDAGSTIEGGAEGAEDGFRFKGGMDHCTEGIWVWSEPFVRKVNGEPVALLLMDTQGAWDGNMTKEQSATIFGLTALISSKQIYNINMQIQEDKVENLAYFMTFAQAALRKAMQGCSKQPGDIEKPFQSLDFLVRDWANFEDDWTMEQCKEQMNKHLDKHVNPDKVVENGTAESLQRMFDRIGCHCLPHPGLKIQKAAWSGTVTDIDRDFIRFIDDYVREVFTVGLTPKKILGSDLSTETFPLVLRTFVQAFHDAAPAAMSFTQAMTSATVLLAKEKALKSYTMKMDEQTAKAKRGMEPAKMEELHRELSKDVEEEFKNVTILGDDKARDSAWESIHERLGTLYKQYSEENDRRLEKALIAFGNIALIAALLFVLDRVSDWTCDWWSQTCRDLSKLMFMAYFGIAAYVGFFAYRLYSERGGLAASAASMELWKEVMRLCGVYVELGKTVKMKDVVEFSKKSTTLMQETLQQLSGDKPIPGGEGKKDK